MCFARDQQMWGVFMIVWAAFVNTVDNFIKPWLIGFGIEMPMSLTVLGVFGGFIAFGFLGLFIGPTPLIAIVFTLSGVASRGLDSLRRRGHGAGGIAAITLMRIIDPVRTPFVCSSD